MNGLAAKKFSSSNLPPESALLCSKRTGYRSRTTGAANLFWHHGWCVHHSLGNTEYWRVSTYITTGFVRGLQQNITSKIRKIAQNVAKHVEIKMKKFEIQALRKGYCRSSPKFRLA